MWKVLLASLLVALNCQCIVAYSKENLHHEMIKLMRNATIRRDYDKHLHLFQQPLQRLTEEFPCEPLSPSPSPPTSVHKLRPADVKVIAALGDSLTAGNGITAVTILGVLIEDRGLAWSIGGDGSFEDQPTLPNILKKYNPNIAGYSVKSGNVESENSHLNVAEPGFESIELEGEVRLLIDRMKSDPEVDFENDWKVITILIGGNDLCEYCNDRETYTVEMYKSRIQTSLDILHNEVPRAFVNLVEVLNVEIVTELNKGLFCSAVHLFVCNCAAFPASEAAYAELKNLTRRYQDAVVELTQSGRYDTRDDFTVVVQPFFRETYLPLHPDGSPDLSFFAPDCFHLSRKGHAAAAEALWNNMVAPVKVKRSNWTPGEPLECPGEEFPYFYTYKNDPDLRGNGKLGQSKSAQRKDVEYLQKESGQSHGTSGSSATVTYVIVALFATFGLAVIVIVVVVRKRKNSYQNFQEKNCKTYGSLI